MYKYIYVCMYICVYVSFYICLYIYIYIYLFIYTYICLCTHLFLQYKQGNNARTHARTHNSAIRIGLFNRILFSETVMKLLFVRFSPVCRIFHLSSASFFVSTLFSNILNIYASYNKSLYIKHNHVVFQE